MAWSNEADAAPLRAARTRTIIGCFLAQNAVMGTAFGSFGPLLASTEAHFGVGRAIAAMGMSLTTLMLALVAAIAGGVLQRYSLRSVMVAGVLTSGAGFLGLAFASSFTIALACYALVGVGVSLAAILTPLALVTRWVSDGRGKVLSIVNLPLVLFACPFLIGEMLPQVGRFGVLTGIGSALLLLVPLLLLLIRDRPPTSVGPGGQAAAAPVAPQATRAIISSPGFWLVSLGIGIMAGSGVVFVVHIVAFGTSIGLSIGAATGLLSIYAGAGLIGTPLFGWLADRVGPPVALVVSGGCQALLWSMLLVAQGPALFLVAACAGICCTPVVTLHGAALSALFDQATVARAMGYSYLCKLPFLFGLAPMIGALYDATGDYQAPFLFCSAALAAATASFCGLAVVARHSARRQAAAL